MDLYYLQDNSYIKIDKPVYVLSVFVYSFMLFLIIAVCYLVYIIRTINLKKQINII